MSAEQIRALAELIKEIGIGVGTVLAAFYGWRNAHRTQRIEKKVEAHEEASAERSHRLLKAAAPPQGDAGGNGE